MSSLLPSHATNHILDGLSEYLTTSFSLAERTTAAGLEKFLKNPVDGMFHGPYIRTRLPYAPSDVTDGLLEWMPDGFVPYRHQAQAFQRLSSLKDGKPRRPQPTLVATGTGSGKTEAFLYPILDHCRRHNALGHFDGVKALILYPMNALANDQAARLATLITSDPALSGVRAGIYTGEDQANRTAVSEAGLITDRETMRQSPPDILLTNYKMLDQLLLRDADAGIWEKSATTLQYVALDEFHTYDGAQGTDVALLLRRMGLRLKKHQPAGFLSAQEAARPLGRITPIATSATLGSGEKATREILDFAHTIFGEPLAPDAVVRETALSMQQWQDTIARFTGITAAPSAMPDTEAIKKINHEIVGLTEEGRAGGLDYDQAVHRVFCQHVFDCSQDVDDAVAAASVSELVTRILHNTVDPIEFDGEAAEKTLVGAVLAPETQRLLGHGAAEFLSHALTEIAYLRAQFGARHGWDGKKFPGVETHLWVREVSRIDRHVGIPTASAPFEEHAMFRWADGGSEQAADNTNWLPACYCRNCGRSGWMAAVQPGEEGIELSGRKIRQQSVRRRDLMRPLLDASGEISSEHYRIDDDNAAVYWLDTAEGQLGATKPSEEQIETGGVVPVLTYAGENADDLARKQACPSCGENDSIRFLGSSISTLLSVAISNLFGMSDLDSTEKKSLVFVDSVQDAAHRAGFIQARARTFAIRTRTRQAIGDTPLRLSQLPDKLMASAQQDALPERAKFEILPPWVAENYRFRGFWDSTASDEDRAKATKRLRDVLELDLALEFGDRSDLSRSLVSTGALSVGVAVTDQELHDAVSELGILGAGGAGAAGADLGARDVAWARGILEYMRQAGGIETTLLSNYLRNDAKTYLLNSRQASAAGIPNFPLGGAPAFPRVGRKLPENAKRKNDYAATPIASSRGTYARWTAAMLKVNNSDAAHLVTALFEAFAKRGIVNTITTTTGATIYTLCPERIVLSPENANKILECTVCHRRLAIDAHGRELLRGANCISTGCEGTFELADNPDNYYRRLYRSRNARTVVAKEHTGLLKSADRVAIENEFKKPVDQQTADAPNVLVATPTLEMGIDIGDLSTVILASLPNTVASYVQRVGRAGRLTGNSLVLAMVVGRQKTLARLANPIDTLGGDVQPPAAFLSAREILHRQFAGYLIDSIDFTETEVQLNFANSVFGLGTRNLVAELVDRLEAGVDDLVEEFAATIADLTREDVLADLRQWVRKDFAAELLKAQRDWRASRQILRDRLEFLKDLASQLDQEAESARADDETVPKLRRTRAALKHTRAQLRESFDNQYWIAALERYGILPNFTLLDDSVEFSVSVSRFDDTTGEFDTDSREYSRGVASALFELAPGATFYAQGIAATVDSVDLGPQNSSLEKWRICPSCSYSEIYPGHVEVPAAGPCPKCGDAHFADISQVKNVVQMRKVSAAVDYSRSAITDVFEDRRTTRFEQIVSMVVPDGGYGKSWFLQHTAFGVQYLPNVEMRWLNLGRAVGGTRQWLAGVEVETPMFRVCRECGHVDSKAGENDWRDHKPWCSLRNAREEDTVDFALGRRLTTQGVLMHLPVTVAAADASTVPSLIAALKMGFKEVLGGNPDHLDVASVFTESDGKAQQMLLLFDTIPGGTGYLSQFTASADIYRLLTQTYTKLNECECQSGSLKACPQCLLPFTPSYEIDVVSRESALAAIKKILLDDDHPDDSAAILDAQSWRRQVTENKPPRSDRSALEQLFLEQLREDLKKLNAKVTESTRGTYAYWDIRFPGTPLRWKMEEQKRLDGSLRELTIPDFYFSVDGADLDRIAVYLDGWQYHASRTHNGVADDIARRNALYDEGIVPWSMTMSDINNRTKTARGEALPQPVWFNTALRQHLNAQLGIDDSMHQLLLADPMTQLLAILREPAAKWRQLSRAACTHAALTVSQAPEALGPLISFGFQGGASSLTFRIHDGNPHEESWRSFLNLANLLYLDAYAAGSNVVAVENIGSDAATASLRTRPPASDSASESQAESAVASAVESAATATVTGVWAEVVEEYKDEGSEVTAAINVLVSAHAAEPSEFGTELYGLMPVLTWNREKIALVYPGEAEDYSDAVKEGWTIIDSAEISASSIPVTLLAES